MRDVSSARSGPAQVSVPLRSSGAILEYRSTYFIPMPRAKAEAHKPQPGALTDGHDDGSAAVLIYGR